MESSRLVQRMLQGLGVPPRVVLLVLCDFLTLLACTLLFVCLRALWGGLDITSYGWMLSMLLVAPLMGLALGLYGGISLPAYVESRKLCAMTSLTQPFPPVASEIYLAIDLISSQASAGHTGTPTSFMTL